MESPEVHTAHARHGGLPRWLELLIAITALVTSISSIAIAVHHGHIMEQLVEANSLPYMQGGFSDVTPEGEEVISLDLLNRGVGPAHQQSLRVAVSGRYVKSLEELIAASVGEARAEEVASALKPMMMKNVVPTRFIPGGEEQKAFRIRKTPENAQYWELMEKAQSEWHVEFCYCSVFKECWFVPSKWDVPQPVEECRRDETREFIP